MKHVLYIFLGGGLGSIARYGVNLLFPLQVGKFPLATTLVNVVGSLLIGVLAGVFLATQKHEALRLFLVVGFCGGFTTFSTFSLESLSLVEDKKIFLAAAYICVSIVAAFVGVVLGKRLSTYVLS